MAEALGEYIKKGKLEDSKILEELDTLFSNSDNKVKVTIQLATNIDELVTDELF